MKEEKKSLFELLKKNKLKKMEVNFNNNLLGGEDFVFEISVRKGKQTLKHNQVKKVYGNPFVIDLRRVLMSMLDDSLNNAGVDWEDEFDGYFLIDASVKLISLVYHKKVVHFERFEERI